MLETLTGFLHLDTVEGASIVAGLITAGCLAFLWQRGHADAEQLPGPPGHWIIGNALDIPHEKEWLVHEKWKRQYGMSMKQNRSAECTEAHISQDRS